MTENYELGIDVSHWQGVMDWGKAKDAGVKFSMIKMTEGESYFDDKFITNWTACQRLGITAGCYHFVRSDIEAAKQFRWIKAKLPSLADFDLALDCEPHSNQQSAQKTTNIIISLSNMLADYIGRRPVIYTNQSFGNLLLPWSEWVNHKLWIASWTTGSAPYMPRHWSDWYMWQYKVHSPGSDYGAVQSTSIDVNRKRAVAPEPEPTEDVTADIQVVVNGIRYSGTAVLHKQV